MRSERGEKTEKWMNEWQRLERVNKRLGRWKEKGSNDERE